MYGGMRSGCSLTCSSPSSSKNLRQNQCCFHTLSTMTSTGTPFVSGMKKKANNIITMIQAAKKKKIPACILHNIDKKACAMMKVQSMLELTAKEYPAVLVSRGKVSLGINQPRGPHDHANPPTNTHTMTTTIKASPLGRSPVAFKSFIRIIPMIVCIYNKMSENLK